MATAEVPIQAKTVIVATGGKHRVLGVRGEIEFEGRGVSRCATCDGAFFQNQPVAVVGGGDTALDEALYLSNIASRVTIIHQRATPIASKTLLRRAREIPKIEFVANATVEEILGRDSIEALRLSNATNVIVAGLFTAIGFEPDTNLLKDLVQLDPIGHAPVDIHMQTTVPGLLPPDRRGKETPDNSQALLAMASLLRWRRTGTSQIFELSRIGGCSAAAYLFALK